MEAVIIQARSRADELSKLAGIRMSGGRAIGTQRPSGVLTRLKKLFVGGSGLKSGKRGKELLAESKRHAAAASEAASKLPPDPRVLRHRS